MTWGTGLSRWTIPHFIVAVLALMLAEAAMTAGGAYPALDLRSPFTLVTVHIAVLGWISLLMLGALYQFVPVMTGKPLWSQNLALASLIAIALGLAGMVAGFLGLAGVAVGAMPWLPAGGVLVVMGFVLAAINLGHTLWQGRPLSLPARFVAAGLGFLVVTGGMGLVFACALALPDPPGWTVVALTSGPLSHVAAGIGGWFSLTAMGVSYRLLSMFMLAPENERRLGRWSLRLSVAGLLATIVGGLSHPTGSPAAAMVLTSGEAAVGCGFALYFCDMVGLYRSRRRRTLELNSRAAAAALGIFALGVVSLAVARATGTIADFAGPIGYLVFFGWLSGLGLSQIYKIVPFLTWLERFGPRMGKGPVPRVQDLVNERRAFPWFVLYFAAVLTAATAVALAAPTAARTAIAAQLAATVFIAREFWRARTAEPVASAVPPADTGARRAGAAAVLPQLLSNQEGKPR